MTNTGGPENAEPADALLAAVVEMLDALDGPSNKVPSYLMMNVRNRVARCQGKPEPFSAQMIAFERAVFDWRDSL